MTSAAPIGSEELSGSGVWMPIRRAVWMILARPVLAFQSRQLGDGERHPRSIDSFTGMTLIDLTIACSRVTGPEKLRP